jgi:flagellar P-ring protein precursor FlgI
MKKLISVICLLALAAQPVMALQVRIKDIAHIAGLEEVPLIGYGIVIGLNGSGDKDIDLTKQTMANLMEVFGISIPIDDITSKNVAAVVVSTRVPAFHRAGDKVDVQVSSIGDATSLEGGILLMTPMLDPEGEVYALAQGGVTVGGFSAGISGPGGDTERKNTTTCGLVPGGAALKISQESNFVENDQMMLVLNHADFTTATRMAEAINTEYEGAALARDAGSVIIRVPDGLLEVGQTARFVSALENLSLVPDMKSKIIVNERTGTIVMGADVHISEAVVAHGNLTVNIGSMLHTEMPEPFTDAPPVVTENITTRAYEERAKVMLVPETTTVSELADVLNEMGATPRDLISILEALRQLGALQMDIQTM